MKPFSCFPSLLAVALAYGSILGPHYASIKTLTSERAPEGVSNVETLALFPLKKRENRARCSLGVYTSEQSSASPLERSIFLEENELNRSTPTDLQLDRRTITLPRYDMFQFFSRQLTGRNFQSIVWSGPDRRDFCTAAFKEIGPMAISLGTQGLCGCTVLLIASRSGAYMAHYWESMAFAPDPRYIAEYGTEEACFEQTVIQGLQSGIVGSNPDKPEQVSLTEKAATIIAGGNIKAYLVVPDKNFDYDENPAGLDAYKAKWAKIRSTVGEIIPALKDDDPVTPNPLWSQITYEAVDESQYARLDTTALGKVLFKYDPDHQGQKKAALWVGDDLTDLHNDQWT